MNKKTQKLVRIDMEDVFNGPGDSWTRYTAVFDDGTESYLGSDGWHMCATENGFRSFRMSLPEPMPTVGQVYTLSNTLDGWRIQP